METQQAVQALAALAQEMRLKIFRLLVQSGEGGLPAGVIAEHMALPASTLSFHLKELTRANLIAPRQEGRFIHYSANYPAMNVLLSFLTENCCKNPALEDAAIPTACCDWPLQQVCSVTTNKKESN